MQRAYRSVRAPGKPYINQPPKRSADVASESYRFGLVI